MPDPNKLEALRAAKFRVLPTCASCRYWHGHRTGVMARWGACPMIPYQHGKHTGDATTLSDKKTSTRLDQIKGDERMASTPDIGWCPNYEADREYLEGRLAAHAMEFFDEGVISV